MSPADEGQNLCKKGLMSVCSGENASEQEKCTYYEKATQENRCRFLKFDEYCDCLKAQMNGERQ